MKYFNWLKEHPWSIAVIVSAISLWYAVVHRFVLDDAFISFRYAKHFAMGEGLVWNLDGTRVEGYTNFLWTVLVSAAFPFGIEIVFFSQIISIICAIVTLWYVYRLTSIILKNTFAPLIALILVCGNFTFLSYTTSGLETQLQTMLLTALVYYIFQSVAEGAYVLKNSVRIALFSSLALLTRLDSAIVVTIVGLYYLYILSIQSTSKKQKALSIIQYILPSLIIVGGWLFWKYQFYGDILPNTFYVRSSSVPSNPGGWTYLFYFTESYWLIPVIIIFFSIFVDSLSSTFLRIIFIVVVVWWGYIVGVGGDFMEFRFFVPTLPLFMILMTGTIVAITDRRLQTAIIVILLLGSFVHAKTFEGKDGIESIPSLVDWSTTQKWDVVGKKMNEYFGSDPSQASIAVRPAGAISYYSELPVIDMLGLNDRWIARNGIIMKNNPGHQRMCPYQYLVDTKVNMVIGHPNIALRILDAPEQYQENAISYFSIIDYSPDITPKNTSIIEIPLDTNWKISVLYLHPSAFIDSVIARNDLKTIKLVR